MSKTNVALFVCACVSVWSVSALNEASADSYTFSTLTQSPGVLGSAAVAINDSGQIVTDYYTSSSSGYYEITNGVVSPITIPGSTGMNIHGINNRGQIVGENISTSGDYGFIDTNGSLVQVTGPYSPYMTALTSMNDYGQAIGYSENWTSPTTLATHSISYQNPGSGTAAWNHIYVFNNTQIQSYLTGINDSGQISGWANNGSTEVAFVTNVDGSINYISNNAASHGIDNDGDVVGDIGYGTAGFVYKNGIFTVVNVPNSTSTHIYGINDAGEIVGSYGDASGYGHAFTAVLTPPAAPDPVPSPSPTPVPEPASLSVLGTSLVILYMLRGQICPNLRDRRRLSQRQ